MKEIFFSLLLEISNSINEISIQVIAGLILMILDNHFRNNKDRYIG